MQKFGAVGTPICFLIVFIIAFQKGSSSKISMPRIVNSDEEANQYVEDQVAAHKVIVFSKTYCPYCVKAKNLLAQLNANAHEIELDLMNPEDGPLIQEALRRLTKQSTVPNIFINKKHIGGCDDTMKLHKAGKLIPLLEAD